MPNVRRGMGGGVLKIIRYISFEKTNVDTGGIKPRNANNTIGISFRLSLFKFGVVVENKHVCLSDNLLNLLYYFFALYRCLLRRKA